MPHDMSMSGSVAAYARKSTPGPDEVVPAAEQEISSTEPAIHELPLPSAWLSWDAAKVIRRLQTFDHVVYLVGGCVRDLLIGRYPKDFDVATSARPAEVKRAFSNCRLIGRRFRLAHILFTNSTIEVATFRRDPSSEAFEDEADENDPDRSLDDTSTPFDPLELEDTEGTLEEKEQAEARDDEHMAVEDDEEEQDLLIRSDNVFGTPREDALRRDFTINGLFYDLASETLIDWVGGLEDVEDRIIRTIGEPEVRFREDPIRMLRAIKFASSLGFVIEEDTWDALCRVTPDIARSAPPRILEEVLRMMRGGVAETCFEQMHRSGLLEAILPEVNAVMFPELPVADQRVLEKPPDDSRGTPDGLASPASNVPERANTRGADETRSHHPAFEPPSKLGVLSLMNALDQIRMGNQSLPNHILLSALFLPSVYRDVGEETTSEQIFDRASELLEAAGTRLRISRRDRELARLTLLGVSKLVRRSSQRGSISPLVRKSYFHDALVICAIVAIARKEWLSEIRHLAKRTSLATEALPVFRYVDVLCRQTSGQEGGEASSSPPGGDTGSAKGRRRRTRRPRRRRGR